MKDDRESGKLLLDCLEDIECKRRRNEAAGLGVAGALLGFELVCSWLVPIEMARESQPVRVAKSMTSSGFV